MNASSFERRLAEAIDLHQRGRLDEAEQAYRRLLQRQPAHPGLLRMLGIVACETGRTERGLELLQRAAALAPNDVDGLANLALAQARAGHRKQAIATSRKALQLRPDDAALHADLAVLLIAEGDPAGALAHAQRAARLEPAAPLRQVQLASALGAAGRHEDAEQVLRQVLARAPTLAEAHYRLGLALHAQDRLTDACAAFERATTLEPGHADAFNNLGHALRLLGQRTAALAALETARALRPDSASVQANLGNTLVDLERLPEAIECYRSALTLGGEDAALLTSLGIALEQSGELEASRSAYERALALAPDDALAQLSFGQLCLLRGEFERGWRGYERRHDLAHLGRTRLPDAAARWDGSALAGRSLFVVSEQGLGDEIMFASLLPELLQEAGRCVVECERRLVQLFTRSFPEASVRARPVAAPDLAARALPEGCDLWIAAGSVPAFRRRTRDDFPPHRGYLRADPARVDDWRSRLDALGPGRKIGLSWRGGMFRTGQVRRSLPLAALQPLLEPPGRAFVSLQYTECAAERAEFTERTGLALHHWQEAIDDYDETAALVSALDVVVSVCTAIVHLTGALGRPALVMAPRIPEWRYGLTGERMIWYPSVRILRQPTAGDWQSVLDEVAAELARD